LMGNSKWWAMQGLNLRPLPCEGLPLRIDMLSISGI
jgi:hypothetical protein